MGKKSPSAPAAPDPAKTAEAQTATNKETALWNAVLNNVNQVTPYGNLTYTQTGGGPQYNNDAYAKALDTWKTSGAGANTNAGGIFQGTDGGQYSYNGGIVKRNGKLVADERTSGKTYVDNLLSGVGYKPGSTGSAMPKLEDFKTATDAPPQFTSTIKLSPEQQAILDRTQANEKSLVDLGGQQLGRIADSVNTPFSFDSLPSYGEADQNAAALKAEEALMARLNPQFARDEEALRTRLINQGIGQGSQAYNTEMERFNQSKNDARTQSILSGQQYGATELASALQRRNQGIQEYTTTRNAPLNEYIGLTSGTQVQNPQFSSQGYQGAAPVDYANLVNNQYQGQLGQYNSQVAGNNSTTSALFGLGGQLGGSFLGSAAGQAAMASMFSDRNLKQHISEAGEKNGHKLYQFEYIPELKIPGKFVGVMAQDVEKYMPEAVIETPMGKAVNYGMLGLEMERV